MAKRFFASEIWEEDWFLEMPNEYKQYWFYMLAKCDHAGIFRVNLRTFRGLIEVNLESKKALALINNGKQRLRVIKDDVWLIEDFFVYQYGVKFNPKNRVHKSVAEVYEKYGISLTSIRGLIVPNDGVKDKDKDNEEVESMGDKERGVGKGEEGRDQISAALGVVIYDIGNYLKLHPIEFEALKMDASRHGLSPPEFEDLLSKFHLWNIEHQQYPKAPLALIAGIGRWIINEKKKANGHSAVNGNGSSKLGTSEGRTKKAREWGSNFIPKGPGSA